MEVCRARHTSLFISVDVFFLLTMAFKGKKGWTDTWMEGGTDGWMVSDEGSGYSTTG